VCWLLMFMISLLFVLMVLDGFIDRKCVDRSAGTSAVQNVSHCARVYKTPLIRSECVLKHSMQ